MPKAPKAQLPKFIDEETELTCIHCGWTGFPTDFTGAAVGSDLTIIDGYVCTICSAKHKAEAEKLDANQA